MRNCPACQHELEQAAIVLGKCPHCGAILRKLSQRTFDNKRLPADSGDDASADEVDEFILDEFLKPEQADTDSGSHTIEISDVTPDDDEPAVDVDDITPLDEDKGLSDLAADVRARDEADEFILGESIDRELIDDADIDHTIEISDAGLDGDKTSPDIDDMTPLEDERQPFEPVGDAAIDYISDESLDLELSDTNHVGPTIEINDANVDDDDDPRVDDDDVTPLEEVASGDRKSPTIDYRADRTMEFPSAPGAAAPADPKPTGRSTHSLESDKTIDLSMSPAEADLVDSQWRGTFDLAPSKAKRFGRGKRSPASARRCR